MQLLWIMYEQIKML